MWVDLYCSGLDEEEMEVSLMKINRSGNGSR
jgi:hypothetical protein